MSRIGNKVIKLAEGTTVNVQDNNVVTVKGPKGELTKKFSDKLTFSFEGADVKVSRPDDTKESKMIHGTTRALLHNMVEGVTHGFSKTLQMEGVGYKGQVKGNKVVVSAGYSHDVELEIPAGITVKTNSPTEMVIEGIDKEVVGEFACEIRAIRKPEPYLGKGIHYKGEHIRRKEGKKAK